MSRVLRSAVVVDYPCSDDRPMAESDFRLAPMLYLLTVLRTHFRDRSDVYVGGDLFVYYREGNPAAVVAPDVFVVIGAPKRLRKSYKLWEEPKGTDFVLEVVSESTWVVDRDEKPELYASLGVGEYWLFDPTGEQYPPRLRGMRLEGGRYRELAPKASVPGRRIVHGAVLGLDVRVDPDGALSLCDSETAEVYVGYAEERAARLEAEARVAELQARLLEMQAGGPPRGDETPA